MLRVRVDLVGSAYDEDAGVVDAGIAGTAAASIVLRIVGLVIWTALTNVLDDLQAGLALTDAVDEDLIGSAGIVSVAPLGNWIKRVPFGTLSAHAVDAVVVVSAVTVEGDRIEDLSDTTLVTVQVGTGGDLGSRFAVFAILGVDCRYKQQGQ